MNTANVKLGPQVTCLGRMMPHFGLLTITAAEHYRYFYIFDTCDVWTADGWLVTAVQNDGETHHVRRDTLTGTVVLPGDTVLYYTPTQKSTHLLAQLAAHS